MRPSGQPAPAVPRVTVAPNTPCRRGQFLFRSSRVTTPIPPHLSIPMAGAAPMFQPPAFCLILLPMCTPKLTLGCAPPSSQRQLGGSGSPGTKGLSPFSFPPPHPHQPGILPSLPAPCQLPGTNTSWGGRGGVKMLSGPRALLGGGGMLGVVGGRGLPTPQHPASPDGGSHPPAKGSVLGGLGRLPAPPRDWEQGADCRSSAMPGYGSPWISGGAAC